jgi:hypothetical protein
MSLKIVELTHKKLEIMLVHPINHLQIHPLTEAVEIIKIKFSNLLIQYRTV